MCWPPRQPWRGGPADAPLAPVLLFRSVRRAKYSLPFFLPIQLPFYLSIQPRGYQAAVTQEDGTEATVLVNEQTDMVSVGQTLKKPAAGLRINGQKYMIVRSFQQGVDPENGRDFKTLYAKKGKDGLCLCVSKQCIIVGTYSGDAGHTAHGCNTAVENLCKYLISVGY